MKKRNNLWKPEGNKPHFGIRLAPKRDPLCEQVDCCKKDNCTPGPCFFLERINGNTERKEALMLDARQDELQQKDYKEYLSELIADRENRIENIINIQDIKQQAITLLLLAGRQKKDIAALLSISERQFRRLAGNGK